MKLKIEKEIKETNILSEEQKEENIKNALLNTASLLESARRYRFDYSICQMANLLNISIASYKRYENGTNIMPLKVYFTLFENIKEWNKNNKSYIERLKSKIQEKNNLKWLFFTLIIKFYEDLY